MYKILIVDDEIEVRQGIVNKINFDEQGFELVGEAENGLEALEIIEEKNPDIAFVDIKMPYMDGLEFAREMYHKYPAIKVVIISGFDEFEFAQQAIRFHVIDYVLKPVSSSDIVKLLQKIKIKLDEEKYKKQDLIQLEKHYLESLPIIRERFLNALVLEKHSIQNLDEKLKRFHIELGEKDFIVAVINPDTSHRIEAEDFDIYAYGVYETCKDLLKDKKVTHFHNHAGDTILIIPDAKELDWMHMLEEIRAVIEKAHLQTVTIGIGEIVKRRNDIHVSYQGAMMALNYKMLEGQNKILWIRDLEPNRLESIVFDEIEESLNQVIRQCHEEGLKQLIADVFDTLSSKQVRIPEIRLFMVEWMLYYLRFTREYELSIEWFENHVNWYPIITSYTDLTSLQTLIGDIGLKVIEGIQKTRKNTVKLMVESTVEYLKNNYHEDITLENMAERLYISPEYLSRQFKKEMDQTFIYYLTSLRLEAAKRLIEDTNYKNFQVADAVGYNEPNYFSYVFKKHFGISPSKYRKSIKEK